MKRILLLFLASISAASAQSNVSATDRYAYGANTGWIDARAGDGTFGMKAGPCVLKGFLYSANCGWINLGDGEPANGVQYSNTAGSDFGVNRLPDGRLRGLAWGASVGWINFEDTGDPRIDPSSGILSGLAWSASTGWISLDTPQTDLAVLSQDSDHDTIPDVWENLQTKDQDLTKLGLGKDADGDGQLDPEEYAAGTDPFDPNDYFRVTSLRFLPGNTNGTIRWTSVTNRSYQVQISTDLKAWQNVYTNAIFGQDGTLTQVSVPRGGPRTFFRVLALKPPAGE